MPAVKPDDRVVKSDRELHVGLEVPRHAARQIYLWANQQPWPDGTELEQPGEYHITLLYTPEGHDENKNAWWLEHMESARVTIDGISAFAAQEKGYAYVLRLDAEDVKEHAEMLQNRAEAWGLSITHFDGGYKPHITVAYGPSSRLTGVQPPNFQFDVGPSSVSPPRPKKESGLGELPPIASATVFPYHAPPSTDLQPGERVDTPEGQGQVLEIDPRESPALPVHVDVEGMDDWYHPDELYRAAFGPKQARYPFPHINRWTGLPCNCGWGGSSHKVPNLRKVGGVNVRKLLKDPAKAYRTPEGQDFRQHLVRLAEESELENAGLTNLDPIVPYVAQRFRKGDIRLQPRQLTTSEQGPMQLHAALRAGGIWDPIEHRLPQWTQFFEARQHPLRRGVDVQNPEFTPRHMSDLAQQHQMALQEAREQERWLANYGPESAYPPEIEHYFGPEAGNKYKGWSVVHLDPGQAEGESEALGHCIGRDDQPYKHNIDAGNINAYSLRDREGYPHVSWHINPSGQSIGHMQGASGYPKPEYRDLISKFNAAKGLPDVEEGEEPLEAEHDDYFTFPEATTQDEFINYHHPESMYDYAYENGNIGEDTEFDWREPDWDSIAEDYLTNGETSGFAEALKNGGGSERFAEALGANFDPQDSEHHRTVGYWNSEHARGGTWVDTPPLEVDNVQDYHNAVDEGIEPYPDWDSIAQDYLNGGSDTAAYYRNQMTPYNHYFHQALADQSHTDEMHNALMENANWEDPDHLEAIQNWNSFPGHSNQQVYQRPESPPAPLPGQQGLWGEPGQGGVFSSKPPAPPNYRKRDKPNEHCGNCKMMWKGKCWGFANVPVEADMVCDDWFPAEKRSAYSPDEVQVLDHLSLTSVAANLHYKFEEGGLDAAGATDYAKRLLKLIGYPPDDITVQAALQAWQQMYPQDVMSGYSQSDISEHNSLEAPPTVPTKSWGYGTSKTALHNSEVDWSGFQANPMQWMPGRWGKGMLIGGQPYTWNTEDSGTAGGSPHHDEVTDAAGLPYTSGYRPYSPDMGWSDRVIIAPEGWYTHAHQFQGRAAQDVIDPTRFVHAVPGMKYVPDEEKWYRRALAKQGKFAYTSGDLTYSFDHTGTLPGWREVDPIPGAQVGIRGDSNPPGTPFTSSEYLGNHVHGRDTGHFGTGLYFVSTPEAAGVLDRAQGQREATLQEERETETFKQRLEEEEDKSSTVPTQVDNPEDHWPTYQDPSKKPHDIEFSNDWNLRIG